jgi:hypothetical protein
MAEVNTPEQPILIVGAPRSGTTLIRSILSAHPHLAISYESNIFSWQTRYPEITRENFDAFWQDFVSSRLFASYHVEAEPLRERVLASGEVSYRGVFGSVCREYAASVNKPRWGEKTPRHYGRLDTLLDWFPDARVLYTLRDPRAVAASTIRAPWGARFVHVPAREWNAAVAVMERWQPDPRVLVVRYEDLVADVEREVRKICEHVGEEFVPEMIGRRSESIPLHANGGWADDQYQRAMSPVSTDSIDKWRASLSAYQIAVIEFVTADGMKRYGYERDSESLRPSQQLRLWFNRLALPFDAFARKCVRHLRAAVR